MEKRGKSIFGGMKIVGNFYSAAPRQAKEAEIDGPPNTSGDASSAPPTEAGIALEEGIARKGVVVRSFLVLDFLNNTKYRVEQSKTDELARKTYRKLPE
ncbi:MAG: hypothetical protein ACWGPR_12300 [Candidatus Deferrimicrobiaceae bacterium]